MQNPHKQTGTGGCGASEYSVMSATCDNLTLTLVTPQASPQRLPPTHHHTLSLPVVTQHLFPSCLTLPWFRIARVCSYLAVLSRFWTGISSRIHFTQQQFFPDRYSKHSLPCLTLSWFPIPRVCSYLPSLSSSFWIVPSFPVYFTQ